MIKLYHAQFTRSIRILWLLEELGVPYELVTVAFKPPRHSFEHDTPTGKFPAIEDDGLVLFESGAILEYLIAFRRSRPTPASTPGTCSTCSSAGSPAVSSLAPTS